MVSFSAQAQILINRYVSITNYSLTHLGAKQLLRGFMLHRQEKQVLESDAKIGLILEQLGMYTTKAHLVFEVSALWLGCMDIQPRLLHIKGQLCCLGN